MRWNKKPSIKSDKTETARTPKRGIVGYSRKSALLEEAITQMNAGKYGRSSAALKELLALDPVNMEARRLFATLHLRLGSLIPAREAFDTLIAEAFQRQDYWLAESLLREYLAAGPRCVPYLEKLGMIYQEKGNALEAVEEYGKAVDILIEDPDPERPDHAGRLYSKIRELAPASPVAFRLASFFDAETGRLVLRQDNILGTGTALHHDVLEADSKEQRAPSRADGTMPWDVQVSSGGGELSTEAAPLSELSRPATHPEPGVDFLQTAQSSEQELLRSDGDAAHQTDSLGLEAQSSVSEELSIQEGQRVQAPSEGAEVSSVTSPPYDSAPSSAHAEISDTSLQSVRSSEQESVRSEEVTADQNRSTDVEAQIDPQADSLQEAGTVPVAEEIGRFMGLEIVEAIHPSSGFERSEAETSVVPSDVHQDPAAVDAVAIQVPEAASPEIPAPILRHEDRPPSGVRESGSELIADPSSGFAESTEEPGPSSTPQTDGGVSPLSLRSEAADAESILAPNTKEVLLQTGEREKPETEANFSFVRRTEPVDSELRPVPTNENIPLQAVQTERLQTEEMAGSPDSPSAAATVSAEEIAQPWKQPGFSWKSVFDTAWKFGEPSPEKDASTSAAATCPDKIVQDPSPLLTSQERPVAEPAGEAPTQESESPNKSQGTLDVPIAPLSLDPVQESVHVSPSVQENSLIAEPLEPPVDQSHESEGAPRIEENQPESSPSIPGSDPETDSFTFAQDVPTVQSEEPHDSTVKTSTAFTAISGTVQEIESAPDFSIAKSLRADEEESSASSEPELQSSGQDLGLSTVVDPREAPAVPANVVIEQEQAHSSEGTESVGQGAQARLPEDLSLPVVDDMCKTSEAVEPAPIEGKVSKFIVEDGGGAPESRRISQPSLHDDQPSDSVNVRTRLSIPEPVSAQQSGMEADVSTRSDRDPVAFSLTSAGSAIPEQEEGSRSFTGSHAQAEAFVASSQIRRMPETRPLNDQPAQHRKSAVTLNGVGTAIAGFLRSCFSTTQAIVRTVIGLTVLVGGGIALGLGALALTWMIMEEPPSPTFQSFTTTPQRTLSGVQKNAYTLLIGIDAPVGQDALREGVEGQSVVGDGTTALGCFGTPGPETGDRLSASASAARGWVRGSDPMGQFKAHQTTIQGWTSRNQVMLERYRQWQKLPFEDWGYGQPASPPCGAMVFAHQLHLADGFVQGTDVAVDRLETDMEMWRVVLSQARTLPVKMLALQAINDDIALASGLLVRSDFDTKHLGRITKFVRPLDQGELSLRWPMQSELVSAGKTYESQLKAARAEGQAISSMVVSALPLPKQRRLNDYAKYYEASYQATGEKQYGSLPKWKDYVRFPAAGVMDYLANPVENLVGVDPLPAWDVYNGMIVDTDAHLRLASLQAWLRRGSSEGDLPNKIAKAGQNFYDPYTGLPMLVNQKKGLLYSVGHDGKDQDADPQSDVVVEIPAGYASTGQTKSSAASSKSR